MAGALEDLDVYNRSFAIALDIHEFSKTLPKIETYALADQMRRSSMSVCANIAEGHGKGYFSKAEFRRLLSIAAGSSQETRVWLKFCVALEYIDAEQGQAWQDEYVQISKMLYGLAKSL